MAKAELKSKPKTKMEFWTPTEKENMNEVLKIAEDFETNPFNVLAEKVRMFQGSWPSRCQTHCRTNTYAPKP